MVGKKQLLTKGIYFYRTYLSSWSSVMCRVYCEYQFLVLSEETCIVTRLGPWRTSGRFRWSHNSLTIAPLAVYILHARETRPEPAETVEKWPKTPSLRDWLIRDMWPHSAPVQSWSKLEAVVWGWFCRICTTFSGVWLRWSSFLWQSWIELIMENGETVTTKSDRNILAGRFRYRTFFRQWSWLQWGYRFALRDFEIEDVESKTISRALETVVTLRLEVKKEHTNRTITNRFYVVRSFFRIRLK